MPRITIDGVELEVEAGRTILQAVDDAGLLMDGVDIPHYCWPPKLTIDGSCRLCQVEVGRLRIQLDDLENVFAAHPAAALIFIGHNRLEYKFLEGGK